MVFSHTNRKGRAYYLHQRQTKTGKTRYVFARTLGEGAIDEVPEGYEVKENVNGVVSLAKMRPQLITDLERQAVRSAMAKLSLDEYRVEARDNTVTVFEPQRRGSDILEACGDLSPFTPSAAWAKGWAAKGNFHPALRFVLDDEQTRTFHVERMTYRGEGGWSYPLGQGKIVNLARKYLPHLGKESFFDLY